jgi:hypothetical protein
MNLLEGPPHVSLTELRANDITQYQNRHADTVRRPFSRRLVEAACRLDDVPQD